MHVLIPDQFTLVNSNVPINEAPIFIHKIYSIGENTVYANGVYERKTATDTFPTFDNKKWYSEGGKASFGSQNYLFQKEILFDNPVADSANWELITTSAWAVSTAYIAGQVRTKNGRSYLCIKNHTSPSTDTIKTWVKYQPSSYYGGVCQYNGRYYSTTIAWVAYNIYSQITPTNTAVWKDVTDTIILPAEASTYWVDITDQLWVGNVFYSAGTATIFSGAVYKAKNDIVLPNPDVDTTRWLIASTSLPTNTDDWTYLGATNRFKMFDQYFSTYTEFNGDMTFSVTSVDFNSIYIGNIFADSITIDVIDNTTAQTVETATIDLTYDCVDIFDYFFGDWMDYRVPTVKYDRTSVYPDVSATITAHGDLNRIGIFCIGRKYFIGDEIWDASIEALDFSTVVEDTATGEVYLSEGNELKVKSTDLWVDTRSMYAIDQILKRAKGKPAVYTSSNENLDTYGFIRQKHEILKGPVKSLISIEVRELL